MKKKKTFKVIYDKDNKNYPYNVQIWINDCYSGFGRFCKDWQEVAKFIKKESNK